MKTRLFGVLAILTLTISLIVFNSPRVRAIPIERTDGPLKSPAEKAIAALDTLIEVTASDASTLDPALAYDTVSFHVIQQVYETLVVLDPVDSGRFLPLLASAWQVSADGLTYTFDIRQGTHFHNGGLLNAHDVAYTIQRGLLQSDPNSPQWTLITPIMGYQSGDITEEIAGGAYAGDPDALQANANPVELLATCNKVMSAISADDTAGRVTINLAEPRGDFIAALAEFAPILDSEWAISQGAWDGDCTTWQNYYAPGVEGSPLSTIANGTGPFSLQSWQPGVTIQLERNPQYWRPGPNVPVNLERAEIKVVADWAQQQQMLLSGEADLADSFFLDVADHVLLSHDRADNWQPTLVHPSGSLRQYTGIYSSFAEDAFFVFSIDPTSSYIGSGMFDGNGIPPDFFSDIHVRKAFNYAFNFDAYADFLESATGRKVIQRTGPIIKDLPGYSEGQPVYAYNPTLALQELQQAWGGQAAAVGFRLTLAYNEGNSTRQAVVENLKTGIEGLDPKFHVDLVELPWSEYLSAYRSLKLPLLVSGWIQDYAHPHNWVLPYLAGIMPGRQAFPADLLAKYQGMVASCLTKTGDPARVCYEDIQQNAYQDAPGIYLFQRTSTEYTRAEVRGFPDTRINFGSSNGAPYFFALWKGSPPVTDSLTPASATNMAFGSTSGATATIDFPADSVNQELDLVITPDVDPLGSAGIETRLQLTKGEYKLGRFAFEAQAYDTNGHLIQDLTLAQAATLTLHYTSQAIAPLIESEILLLQWDGNQWIDGACGDYQRDTNGNILTVPICKTGLFTLGGVTNDIYLPLTIRQ